jgi:hypothetical protein
MDEIHLAAAVKTHSHYATHSRIHACQRKRSFINQSINQSINQPTNQPTNQINQINQPFKSIKSNQSNQINQTKSIKSNQWTNKPTKSNQINGPIKSINQSTDPVSRLHCRIRQWPYHSMRRVSLS